jgi:hypothetical protein
MISSGLLAPYQSVSTEASLDRPNYKSAYRNKSRNNVFQTTLHFFPILIEKVYMVTRNKYIRQRIFLGMTNICPAPSHQQNPPLMLVCIQLEGVGLA